MTRRFVLDVESTSTVDLKKAGPAAYWQHPGTVLVCVCYRVDDGPIYRWVPGDPIPYFVPELSGGGWRVVAHNWLFEWYAWGNWLAPRQGWTLPGARAWDCTMARSLYWGLPAKLEHVAEAMALPVTIDPEKNKRILRTARPRSIDKATGVPVWWHETDPEKREQLLVDCETDVHVESLLDAVLPPLPARERKIFEIDGRINQRGIKVDLALVDRLAQITDIEAGRLNERMAWLTAGKVKTTNQVKLIGECVNALGVVVPDLAKDTVAAVLSRPERLPEQARDILLTRQEAAKSSTGKLAAMRAGASAWDGRCRCLFQYGGAGRTLRWAGRRVQPQNYPRGTVKNLHNVYPLVLDGIDVADLDMLVPGTVMDAVASMLRGCLVADAGNVLVSGDLAQIEARVIAWLAGQNDLLEVFRRGEDVYTYTAGKIGSDSRQLGKVLVLACIAEGSPVLTDQGLVPIEKVTCDMRVWDGLEWVTHDGVICRGEQEVIEYDGLRATPDHHVWTEGRGDAVPLGRAASQMERLVRSGAGGTPLRVVESAGPDLCPGGEKQRDFVPVSWVRSREVGGLAEPSARQNQGLSVPVPFEHEPLPEGLDAQAGPTHDVGAQPMPEPRKSELEGLRWPGDYVRVCEHAGGGRLGGGEPGTANRGGTGDRPDEQREGLRTGQSALGDAGTAEPKHAPHKNPCPADMAVPLLSGHDAPLSACGLVPGRDNGSSAPGCGREAQGLAADRTKARVYDILNAGPRHRFTVSGRLVSNCGFGMGPDRFQETALTYGVELELWQAELAVSAWRGLNHNIVSFWYDVDRVVKRIAVSPHGTAERLGKLIFTKTRKAMRITLPSTREMTYQLIEVESDGEGGWDVSYMGVHPKTKLWSRIRTYGARICENVTQALARDVLTESMIALEVDGEQIVGTVHDELLLETTEAKGPALLAKTLKILGQTPVWAPGLPVSAEGWFGPRYKK